MDVGQSVPHSTHLAYPAALKGLKLNKRRHSDAVKISLAFWWVGSEELEFM